VRPGTPELGDTTRERFSEESPPLTEFNSPGEECGRPLLGGIDSKTESIRLLSLEFHFAEVPS